METKYFVALLNGDSEKILGIFNSKKEADAYGTANLIPHDEGLEYCFCAKVVDNQPQWDNIIIFDYYNLDSSKAYA